jgi:prophage regulatory protein
MDLRNETKPRRLLRLPGVLGRVPICRSGFLARVKSGEYPQPIRLGRRTVAWDEADIDALIDRLKREQGLEVKEAR